MHARRTATRCHAGQAPSADMSRAFRRRRRFAAAMRERKVDIPPPRPRQLPFRPVLGLKCLPRAPVSQDGVAAAQRHTDFAGRRA